MDNFLMSNAAAMVGIVLAVSTYVWGIGFCTFPGASLRRALSPMITGIPAITIFTYRLFQ